MPIKAVARERREGVAVDGDRSPLVISRPMPRSEVSVASVMMKGGRPILTMPKPWKMPMATPTRSVTRMAIQMREAGIHHHGDDDGGEADHGADRQVDAAGDDDEGLADRHDRDHRALPQQVGDVVGGGEARRRNGKHDPEQQPATPAASARTGRCSCASVSRRQSPRCSYLSSQLFLFLSRAPA